MEFSLEVLSIVAVDVVLFVCDCEADETPFEAVVCWLFVRSVFTVLKCCRFVCECRKYRFSTSFKVCFCYEQNMKRLRLTKFNEHIPSHDPLSTSRIAVVSEAGCRAT